MLAQKAIRRVVTKGASTQGYCSRNNVNLIVLTFVISRLGINVGVNLQKARVIA